MSEGLKLDTGEIGDNERRGTMKGRDLIKPGGINPGQGRWDVILPRKVERNQKEFDLGVP